MSDGGVVTISADKILEIADKIKSVETELRQLGLRGLDIQQTTRAPQKQTSKTDAMLIEFDILSLDWKRPKKSGGGDAGPDAPWAWTFAYEDSESPYPREDAYDLVTSIIRYGEVKCGKYIVKLSGRDSRLLNRTIAK